MTEVDGSSTPAVVPEKYRSLPPKVALDKTIASVEANLVADPHAGRNVDQHLALRED